MLHSVGEKHRAGRQYNAVERHPFGIYSKKQKLMEGNRSQLATKPVSKPGSKPVSKAGSRLNKENTPSRTVRTAPPVPKREQKGFIGNIKKPLTTLCKRSPVLSWKPETQADSLMLVKASKARKNTEGNLTKVNGTSAKVNSFQV